MPRRYTCEVLIGPTNNSGSPIAEESATTPNAAVRKAVVAAEETAKTYAKPGDLFTALVYRNRGSHVDEMRLVEGQTSIKTATAALLS